MELSSSASGKFPLGGGPRSRRTPSFSSALLDSICRSMDEPRRDRGPSPPTLRPGGGGDGFETLREEMRNLRRAASADKRDYLRRGCSSSTSTSSSSGSSCGGSGSGVSSLRQHGFRAGRDGAARAGEMPSSTQPKSGGRFTRTKSRALKIYGDLKRANHPVSPGRRIASFLNSLFSGSGSTKKSVGSRPVHPADERLPKYVKEPASNAVTPSSNASRGDRRVRFPSASVILDEQEHDESTNRARIPGFAARSKNREPKNRATAERPRTPDLDGNCNLPRKFHQKQSTVVSEVRWDARRLYGGGGWVEKDEEDAESCASSDLFELDDSLFVEIGKYRQELPVYETTDWETNHAIAGGD